MEVMEIRAQGPSNPCDDPLPTLCPGDIWGPDNQPDNQINVSDLLKVIDTWGQFGDGSFRPAGDCSPLPTGDCEVNVSDLLAVIDGWGGECTPPATGACCIAAGNCLSAVTEDQCPSGGTWSEDATCTDLNCD